MYQALHIPIMVKDDEPKMLMPVRKSGKEVFNETLIKLRKGSDIEEELEELHSRHSQSPISVSKSKSARIKKTE
jgi:hypothetical protein